MGDLGGAEEQYRLLMDCVTDYAIFLLDADGKVATWNAGAERTFGYAAEEVLGRPVGCVFTPEDRERGVPEHELTTAVEQGRASDDRWHVRKDGTRFWANETAHALRDGQGRLKGFAKVCRDLTGQKLAEEAMHASERRLRALLENAWDGVSLLGADVTVQYTTPATWRSLGYPDEEFVGHSVFEFVHPDDLHHIRALLGKLLAEPGGRVTAQYRMRHKDGSWRWVESVATNLLNDPAVAAVVINRRDVTEQRAAEGALKEADRRKDEFLATLAHELRGPLAPLSNGLHLLEAAGGDEKLAGRAREMMGRQVGQLVRLVDDLLEVSRVKQGKVRLAREPVEVARVVAQAVETCGPLIEAKRHRLDVTLASEPVRVDGDPSRLSQVVANLLSNAAKYTPDGGHIRVVAERDGGEVVLRVSDDGIGVRREVLPRLFDLFVQAEPGLGHSQGGLGIGLALVKSFVELHGGSVEAKSGGPGQGSEFTVRLPVMEMLSRQSPAKAAAVEKATPRRVLVVDDNEDAADSLAMILRLLGHDVRTAHEGSAALDAAREFRPEFALLDIGLPGGLSGYDLARRLREEPGLGGMRLVALTGYGQEEDKRRAMEAGFDAHLTKPADLDALKYLLAGRPPRGTGCAASPQG